MSVRVLLIQIIRVKSRLFYSITESLTLKLRRVIVSRNLSSRGVRHHLSKRLTSSKTRREVLVGSGLPAIRKPKVFGVWHEEDTFRHGHIEFSFVDIWV